MTVPYTSVARGAEAVVKKLIGADTDAENLLQPDAWRPWQLGFERQGDVLFCDNGTDNAAQRGAGQTIELNQSHPHPIVATAWSRCEAVTGSPDANYSLYLDLVFQDGSQLWGQHAAFDTDTHDWQQRRVVILPEKPVRRVSYYLLFRQHAGRVWFRDPHLATRRTPEHAALFDGLAVSMEGPAEGGFQLRDVAANSGFVRFESGTLGLELECHQQQRQNATFYDVTIRDQRRADRAVTLVYAIPIASNGLTWLDGPHTARPIEPSREYTNTSRFRAGANGRLSRYPLGAVADSHHGTALAIDMSRPAFFRVGYAAGTQELYLAYDIALTHEKPHAHVRFCQYQFDPEWGFRKALDRYYQLYPQHEPAGSAVSPCPVQGQAVLLFDEHPFRRLLARFGRALHEAGRRVRPLSWFLQSQRLARALFQASRALRTGSQAVSEIRSHLSRISEAGWQPITAARCDTPEIWLERFGDRYLTIYNSSTDQRSVVIRFDPSWAVQGLHRSARDLTDDHQLKWNDGGLHLTIDSEDLSVVDVLGAEHSGN